MAQPAQGSTQITPLSSVTETDSTPAQPKQGGKVANLAATLSSMKLQPAQSKTRPLPQQAPSSSQEATSKAALQTLPPPKKPPGAVALFGTQMPARLHLEIHKDLMQELGFRFSMASFEGIAANVRSLIQRVEALINRVQHPLSATEIFTVLNDARACMQAVENIFKALGASDDYRAEFVRKKVDSRKAELRQLIDDLVTRTNALTETPQFEEGIKNIPDIEPEKDALVEQAINAYSTKASHTLGVVNFEKDVNSADAALDELEIAPQHVGIALSHATLAMDRATDGLTSFQEACSVVNGYKNSLLDKMKSCRNKLAGKVGQVISKPEVKVHLEQQQEKLVEYKAKEKEAEQASHEIEQPAKSVACLIDEQKDFVTIVNKASSPGVQLPEELKSKLNNLAARMMPLIKVLAEAKLAKTELAKGDICSLAQSMIDFLLFYQHFVSIHQDAIDVSTNAYSDMRFRSELGLDQLVIYLRDNPYLRFREVRKDAKQFLGEEIDREFTASLDKAHEMYAELMKKVK